MSLYYYRKRQDSWWHKSTDFILQSGRDGSSGWRSSSIHYMGTEVRWSSRVTVGHKQSKGKKKDEFTCAEKAVSITQEITTHAHALPAQQAARTRLLEICSSVGWLPAMAHRHTATQLLKKAVQTIWSFSYHKNVTSYDHSFMVVDYNDMRAMH